MSHRIKIGIVGCGAIGTSLARAIRRDFRKGAYVAALFDIDEAKAVKVAGLLGDSKLVAGSLTRLIAASGLVVEATHMNAAYGIARKALTARRDIMIMSVGGILSRFRQLQALAGKKGVRLYIPSGAIAGVDAVKAASFGKLKEVVLRTTKPAKAFRGVPYVSRKKINLKEIRKDTVIFRGNAFSATKAFPQNINVASTLSLAGWGASRTVVEIVASPRARRNIHEVEVISDAGTITSRTENVAHPDNPKTSYLAVLSALAMLKGIIEPVRIGS
jgi:aspartate dehydrogenase